MSTTDAIVLIQNIQKENLYVQTIHQLNKDFQLANIDKAIDDLLEPNDLKKVLDSLGVERYCCRAQFMGHVDLSDTAAKFKKF